MQINRDFTLSRNVILVSESADTAIKSRLFI